MDIKKLEERGIKAITEDQLLVKDNLYAVFDGASSLINDAYEGKTGGYLASFIAKKKFSSGKGLLQNLVLAANRAIALEMSKRGVDVTKKENRWCTTVAAVRINRNSFDWIQVGDSNILLIFEDHSHQLLVPDFDHDQEMMIRWKELGNLSWEEKRGILSEEMIQLRRMQNISYGFLNGEEQASSFMKIGKKSLKDVKHILLFTDGLLLPKENPRGKDDWKKFVALYLQGGLEQIKKGVRQIERSDSECIKYPRYRSHDDIAAISISF